MGFHLAAVGSTGTAHAALPAGAGECVDMSPQSLLLLLLLL
jgi:hypothetical protein